MHDLQLDGDHLAFQCSDATGAQPPNVQSLNVRGFDGRFDQGYTQIWGLLRMGRGEIPVTFTRPEESRASAFGGHWINTEFGRTTILHVYDDSAVMDFYNSGQATFGLQVGFAELEDSRFRVDWADIGPHSFIGSTTGENRDDSKEEGF